MSESTASDKPHPNGDTLKQADKDGEFRRQTSQFRNFISPDPAAEFPAEAGRYVLYVNVGCPWAHRTRITRKLKGLEDIIELAVCDFVLTQDGWLFTGANGSMPADPLYGFTSLKQMYIKADPGYAARFTVPMLWDRQRETVVSNESADIIRMLYSAFDALLPPERREAAHPLGGYLPGDAKLRGEIEAMNEWVYDAVNNGVYKTGFAAEQAVYSKHLHALFKGLDRLEAHLASPDKPPGPYLFGEHITEADIRLYPTIVRFDVAYHSTFKCNLGMIRQDYPLLDRWLRTVYWNNEAFKETTVFEPVKLGYARAKKLDVYAEGPLPHIGPKP